MSKFIETKIDAVTLLFINVINVLRSNFTIYYAGNFKNLYEVAPDNTQNPRKNCNSSVKGRRFLIRSTMKVDGNYW